MTTVLVVPTAPALLGEAAPGLPMDVPDEWGALRERVHATMAHVAGATVVVSLVAGPATAVVSGGVADLRPYGLPDRSTTHPGHDEVAEVLGGALGVAPPAAGDATLPLDAAVHARLAGAHDVGAIVVVEVAPDGRDAAAGALAALAPRGDVAVLVQGDLASSPIRRTDSDRGAEATAWDAAAVPLLRAGDVAAWRCLVPGDVEPRGLDPLAVAMAWLGERWDGTSLHWEAPRGIGAVTGLVATL